MMIPRALIAAFLFTAVSVPASASTPLTGEDAAALRKTCGDYVAAWPANDKAAVLATLSDDAVLLPAHGRPAVVGKKAIEAFGWPATSLSSSVDAFTSTVDEIGGVPGFGWARGSFDLTFTYDGKTKSQHGTYLMLLRREENGVWRITHRMWDDRLK